MTSLSHVCALSLLVLCSFIGMTNGQIIYPPPAGATPTPYSYETRYFTSAVDHFDFGQTNLTFQTKYLFNDEFYQPGGPIFFYTGNEGPIELFCNNTGFMWDIAPQFNALLVFAEHRYYGSSLPFGNESFTNANYVHLSAEQALADYAILITSLKVNMSIPNAPVIAFGGSYGGMLTGWFRKKYPHIVAGAISGSAPLWFFNGEISGEFDPGTYNRIASNDFKAVSQNCFDNIAASWNAMVSLASTPAGLEKLSDILGLCPPLESAADVPNLVWPWLSNIYASVPMGDYPYPASFFGPLPAYPVTVICGYWNSSNMDPTDLAEASRMTANLFYNYSGQAGQCHNMANEQGIAPLGITTQWAYQTCTEMIMPIGQYGPPNDLFYPAPWNLTSTIEYCQETFGVTPQPYWIEAEFGVGAADWSDATNICFSNGLLDPWSGGGVLKPISDTVVALPVVGGAHHLDLRAYNTLDPQSVISVRQQEVAWIESFKAFHSSSSKPASAPIALE